jgi:hypothetical protein
MNEDERSAEAELAGTWAGVTFLEEIRLAEMRVLLDQALAAGVTRTALAAELGVSVTRLATFLDGANLGSRSFERVAQWCEGKPTPRVSPYVVAIGVLCHWFPVKFVKTARGLLWAYVRRMAEASKVDLPEFATKEVDALYPPDGQRVPMRRIAKAG